MTKFLTIVAYLGILVLVVFGIVEVVVAFYGVLVTIVPAAGNLLLRR